MANIILLYGPIAVGKLTIAKLLATKLGYKLTHNHSINDLVSDIFDHNSVEYARVVEKMRLIFLSEIAENNIDTVTTHCFSYNFVNKATGVSDPEYVVNLYDRLTQAGATVCVVHLIADNETLYSRVSNISRKEYKKLIDEEEMKRISNTNDWETSAPIDGQLVLDTTHLTVQQCLEQIITHFNLEQTV